MDSKIVGLFVFCVTFLGVFTVACNTMPMGFFPVVEREEVAYLTEWKAGELFFSNVTDYDNKTIVEMGTANTLYLSDYDIRVRVIYWGGSIGLQVQHYWYTFWGLWSEADWIEPEPLTLSYLLAHVQEDNENISSFAMSCEHYSYSVMVTYNESKYERLEDAYYGVGNGWIGELSFYIGCGYEERPATINAWTLASQLLLFQAPDIHPLINAFIAIPLWACISIISFLLIMYVFKP